MTEEVKKESKFKEILRIVKDVLRIAESLLVISRGRDGK